MTNEQIRKFAEGTAVNVLRRLEIEFLSKLIREVIRFELDEVSKLLVEEAKSHSNDDPWDVGYRGACANIMSILEKR